jgi:hypothetical protein
MTKPSKGQKSVATAKKKGSPAPKMERRDPKKMNGGLAEKQVLALWELIVTGDGKMAKERLVELKPSDVKSLVNAGLITVENGPRPKQPSYMSKIHLADKAWRWANHEGLNVCVPRRGQATALVFEALLVKMGDYLQKRKLGLHQLLAPRAADPEPVEPAQLAGATLEERIRSAYLRVTGGALNQQIDLAHLRAALGGEPVEAVNEELRHMQERGSIVLYPTDDPQRLRPEDEAAAMRVAGERRDVVAIRG